MTGNLVRLCTVFVVAFQQLAAVCMPPPPPCEALAQSQVVFYGETQEVTSQPYVVGSSVALLSVRFNVLRAFKGVKEGPLSETFYYGTEAVRFEPKKRYLVYAIRRPGEFLVVGCTRSEWLAAQSEPVRNREISELDRCPKSKTGW